MKYNFCFSADETYIKYFMVLVQGILEHIPEEQKNNNNFVFHLITNKLKSETEQKLLSYARSTINSNNGELKIYHIEDDMFKDFMPWGTGEGKYATYYRLKIADLLERSIEKCLYLDIDVVIMDNVLPIFEIELGDNILAGCSDVYSQVKPHTLKSKKSAPDYVYKEHKNYVNAGILLINLNEWRKNHVDKKCIEFLNNYKTLMPDQDALNAVCSGKIKLIEPRWNIMPSHYFMQLNASGIWETHGKSTNFAYLDTAYNLKTNREEPAIVHMTEIKPWGAFHCYDYTIVPDFTDKNLNNIIEQWMKSALNVKEYQYYFNNLKKFYSEKIFIKEAQQVDFILKNVFKQIKRIKKRNRIKFYLMGLSLVINYMLLIFLLLE